MTLYVHKYFAKFTKKVKFEYGMDWYNRLKWRVVLITAKKI